MHSHVISRPAAGLGQAGALILSSFEEVLLLDSDNVALADPDPADAADPAGSVFRTPGYERTGLVVWPDYWRASAAPDLFEIAPDLRGHMARRKDTFRLFDRSNVRPFDPFTPPAQEGTAESGQLLADKRRAWEGLLVALFLNLQAPLYTRLLTSYMGAGDKETFRAGMAIAGLVRSAAAGDGCAFALGMCVCGCV